MSARTTICVKCAKTTLERGATGRYGRFLHIGCFNAWWKSEYGDTGGPYYRWMRQGMCVR